MGFSTEDDLRGIYHAHRAQIHGAGEDFIEDGRTGSGLKEVVL
jgi:hypothetical protein